MLAKNEIYIKLTAAIRNNWMCICSRTVRAERAAVLWLDSVRVFAVVVIVIVIGIVIDTYPSDRPLCASELAIGNDGHREAAKLDFLPDRRRSCFCGAFFRFATINHVTVQKVVNMKNGY